MLILKIIFKIYYINIFLIKNHHQTSKYYLITIVIKKKTEGKITEPSH